MQLPNKHAPARSPAHARATMADTLPGATATSGGGGGYGSYVDAGAAGAYTGHRFKGVLGTRLFDDDVYMVMLKHDAQHRHPINILIHVVTVPICVVCLFTWLTTPAAPSALALAVVVAVPLYCAALLDWLTGVMLFGAYWHAHQLALSLHQDVPYADLAALGGYLAAGGLQFVVGHRILEGAYPTQRYRDRRVMALETAYEVLVVPALFLLQGLCAMGYHPRLRMLLAAARDKASKSE